jgi:hypothetical protein
MLNASRRDFYTDAHAARHQAGERYEPSNGTEGTLFLEHWCEHCAVPLRSKDESCDIATRAFWCPSDDPAYPVEWQHGADGQPECTAFEEAAQP